MDRIDDGQIVGDARSGSSRARSVLFRRHYRRAWQRAFAVCGRAPLADDITQDAFVRAFERLDDLENPSAFGAWLTQIVTHRALDELRRESRLAPEGEVPERPEWVGDLADERGRVQQAVGALGDERRVVVVMRYWLDLTPAEIADELELPVGTVHSRLARALAELRAGLEEEGADG